MDYKVIRLGDYIKDIASGPFGSNLKVDCFVPDGFPIIDGANLMGTRVTDNITKFVTEEKARSLSRSIAKKHDVVVTISGTLGQVAYIPLNSKYQEYLCSQRQFRVTFDESKIDVEYLVYYLHTKQGQKKILSFANYVGVPALAQPLPNFKNIEINLPPLDYQHKIASIIGGINDKISLNCRINAELEAMAKQLYDYWFVQFDFPDENGKPYKSSGGKMVYNEKLKREIPEGWGAKPVSNFIEHINTGLNPRQNFVLGNGNIKYITVKNLRTDGTIDFSNCDLIDEDARAKVHKRSAIQIKDILFASIAPLGRCHIIMRDPEDWDINESVFSIRPKQELISPYYLYIYFMSDWFVKKAEKETAGSIFAGIRVNSLMEMPLLYAPHRIFELFEEKVDSIFKKRELLSIENNNLVHLRDSLLPMLMNGQVTVE